jgi:hypothetical protein
VLDTHERARRKRLTTFVGYLARSGDLNENWTQELAVDLLWLLSSFASFDQVVKRSRLSVEAAAKLLAETAAILLKPNKRRP